ncbi:MAG: hypothetical protein FVQ79_08430 [Planctomycetes bacterium]|nr:hypothetical protein [Planctomycetota bacterium]
MVIQTVATRKIAKILKSSCVLYYSRSQVTAICQKLNSEVQACPESATPAALNELAECYESIAIDLRKSAEQFV